ncbi:MAG: isopentenyl-diphosphate Delta-isomerase [bacterium]|nr:isopentenyl-diphosphate Delta-isomerase [bacterium]
MSSLEHVVLVDESNAVLGTTPKAEVHQAVTPLHRGFSLFLFNRRGQVLLQQRSSKKKTWPLVWSNSCCGHPELGETNVRAAERRLREELGMRAEVLEEVAPYRYRYSRDGVMENEICPILVGFTHEEPLLDPDEVEAVAWLDWGAFLQDIAANPGKYSDWCIEEVGILKAHPRFRELMSGAA